MMQAEIRDNPSVEEISSSIICSLTRLGADECPTEVDRDALYDQFQPLVGSLLRKYGKTVELRKDLRGEIYYQFCRLVNAYDPSQGIPIRAYLHNMLKQSVFNYVRDYWRKESRFIQLEESQQVETLGDSVVADSCLDELISQELRSALPSAIAKLPHRQRLVVVWRYYDGRTFEDIAEQFRLKPATARSLLRHGIAHLRKLLSSQEF
jgi:RNA polymerase sigma factor (sigma-70 family)